MGLRQRLSISICLALGLSAFSACSMLEKTDSATPTAKPTISKTPSPSSSSIQSQTPDIQLPKLDVHSSQLTCDNSSPNIMWQGIQHPSADATVKVAGLQCGASESPEFGQVIETFALENGLWTSQGLASGPDVSWRIIGACSFAPGEYSCPAQALSEDGNQLDGFLVITVGSENTTWQFGLKS